MTEHDIDTLPAEILDLPIQMNVRITVRSRSRLEAYIKYMDRPSTDRPSNTEDWPTTIQGVIQDALDKFLATHPLREKSGPEKKPVRTAKKGVRKTSK